MGRSILIVMAKRPAPGRTKTRLTPPLDAIEAAELYRCLLLDTLDAVRAAALLAPLTPAIAYAPAAAESYFRSLAPDFALLPQQGPDLSRRLAGVMLAAGARGYGQVAAINSDSPGLPPAFLAEAFERLAEPRIDAVLGPTEDGGYYLIAWRRPFPQLILEVTMSTPRVLADTLAVARREGVRVALLPAWHDLDTAEDLARLRAAAEAGGEAGPRTSAFLARL